MIIWLAMLIPFIGCAIAYKLFPKKFVWWELALPTLICFLFILTTKFTVEKTLLSDTQYRGGIIVEARYYEYWSTWVERTCYRDGPCISHDKNGNCTAHQQIPYDCSYCDENNPYWKIYDDQGHSWNISEEEYNRLVKQWKATPEFVELNRNIDRTTGCGQDGDMYRIRWDGNMLTSESSTWETTYENHVQVAKTNFDLRDVSEKEAKKYGLYAYPKVNNYKQENILGIDSLNYLQPNYKLGAKKMFEYFNGTYGPKRKLRLYTLLFFDKPIDIAIKQRNYWDGGNKNEVVLCIDVNRNTGKINWVYPFSWGENKRIGIDLREDVANMDTLNFTKLYHIADKSTETFVYRDFTQFNYLAVDPPTWEVWFVYIFTIMITVGVLIFGHKNEFENET